MFPMRWALGGMATAATVAVVTACLDEPLVARGGGGAVAGLAGAGGSGAMSGGRGGAEHGGAGAAGATGGEEEAICDGSTGLRFAIVLRPFPPRMDSYRMMEELGTYIFVSGECDFYAWRRNPDYHHSLWNPARTGRLDLATAQELASDFAYSEWGDLAGVYSLPPMWPAADGYSVLALYNGTQSIRCDGGCGDTPALAEAYSRFGTWVDRLYRSGEDLDGPLRFSFQNGPGNCVVDWPLALTPAEQSQLSITPIIEDPADWARLRALRPLLLEQTCDPPASALVGSIPYYFFFRDMVPFEDEHGTIPGLW